MTCFLFTAASLVVDDFLDFLLACENSVQLGDVGYPISFVRLIMYSSLMLRSLISATNSA